MEYFSVTFMVPMMDSVSMSHSATSSPMAMELARSSVGGKGNRDGPEKALLAGQAVGFTTAPPVIPAHKSLEGSKRANPHHDEITCLPSGHGNSFKAFGFLALLLPRMSLPKEEALIDCSREGESACSLEPPREIARGGHAPHACLESPQTVDRFECLAAKPKRQHDTFCKVHAPRGKT